MKNHLYNIHMRFFILHFSFFIFTILCVEINTYAQQTTNQTQRSVTLAEGGRCSEALPLLKKSFAGMLSKDQKKSVGLAGVKCAMSLNKPEQAIDFIRVLTAQFPDDPEVLYQAVHIYSDLSMRASQDLFHKAQNSYQVRLLNAEALETQGRWNEAADEYRVILLQNPNIPGMHYRLGRLLLSMPDAPSTVRDEARKEFEAEVKINPNNAGAQFVLGELARQAGENTIAVDHFSKATKNDPLFIDAFIGLGRAFIAEKKFAEAVPPLETAAKQQPDNPQPHYQLSIAYARLGRKEDSERAATAFKMTSEKADLLKHKGVQPQ